MRVVADTNTIVSALLWKGSPRQILNMARRGNVALYTSLALLAELEDVLNREKFSERLEAANVTVEDLVLGYAALATLVKPERIEPTIIDDPDDDAILACAVGAKAEIIVSGDHHLLKLGQYKDTNILTAQQLLERLEA